MHVIVDSVGNCSGYRLTSRPSHATNLNEELPFVIGTHEAIRYVSLWAHKEGNTEQIYRSIQISYDYSQYQHLWTNINDSEPPDVVIARGMWDNDVLIAWGAGQSLGKIHDLQVLHGDAHMDNFYSQGFDPALAGDLDDSRVFCRALTAAECASDLVPLLTTIDPAQWRAFRLGYFYARRSDGLKVIALIQLGRDKYLSAIQSGWRLQLRNDHWGSYLGTDDEKALRLLDHVLEARADTPEEEQLVMLAVRCQLLYATGRRQEGATAAFAVLDFAASISDMTLVKLGLAVAEWQFQHDDRTSASISLERVIQLNLALPDRLANTAAQLLGKMDREGDRTK